MDISFNYNTWYRMLQTLEMHWLGDDTLFLWNISIFIRLCWGGFAIYRHLYFSRDIENIRWIYHVLFSHFLCFASHSCIRFQINWLVLKLIALQLRDYGVFSSKKYNSFHSHANVEFLSKSENYWIFHWNMMSLESNFS